MCCSKRGNKQQQQFPAAVAGAGASTQRTNHAANDPFLPQHPTTTIPIPPAELNAGRLHDEAEAEEQKELPINPPPSYDTIVTVNRAIVPDQNPTPYAQPALMNRKEADQDVNSNSSSSNFSVDSMAATLPQETKAASNSMVEIPEGLTWWQAYRARKVERREAWRAEKAEWRAAKRAEKGRRCY
ncbi:hypothetical protein BST61_g11330 [Cercospora zeina]